jgi:hypothetical protein
MTRKRPYWSGFRMPVALISPHAQLAGLRKAPKVRNRGRPLSVKAKARHCDFGGDTSGARVDDGCKRDREQSRSLQRTLLLTWAGLAPAGSHQLAAGALTR